MFQNVPPYISSTSQSPFQCVNQCKERKKREEVEHDGKKIKRGFMRPLVRHASKCRHSHSGFNPLFTHAPANRHPAPTGGLPSNQLPPLTPQTRTFFLHNLGGSCFTPAHPTWHSGIRLQRLRVNHAVVFTAPRRRWKSRLCVAVWHRGDGVQNFAAAEVPFVVSCQACGMESFVDLHG